MHFNCNKPVGIVNNPLTNSPFKLCFEEGGFPTPPSEDFIISEEGIFIITETTLQRMITE